MKRNKTAFMISLVFGFFTVVFWLLRMWHPNIDILIPLTLNTFQFGFMVFMGSGRN